MISIQVITILFTSEETWNLFLLEINPLTSNFSFVFVCPRGVFGTDLAEAVWVHVKLITLKKAITLSSLLGYE